MLQYVLYFSALVAIALGTSTNTIRLPLTPIPDPEFTKIVGKHAKLDAVPQLFVATIELVEENRNLTVLMDTTSSWIRIPSSECRNCVNNPSSKCPFNNATSITATLRGEHDVANGVRCQGTIEINGFQVKKQEFVDFSSGETSLDHENYQGFFGLGYEKLSQYRTQDGMIHNAATLVRHLKKQSHFKQRFSIYISRSSNKSFILFGDSDPNYYEGDLVYRRPLQDNWKEHPIKARRTYSYWMMNTTSFSINEIEMVPNTWMASVIDTTVSAIYLPPDFITVYETISQVNIANRNIISCADVPKLPTLIFVFDTITYRLESEYYVIHAGDGTCLVLIKETEEREIRIGTTFFNKYYAEFDVYNNRTGFAIAKH